MVLLRPSSLSLAQIGSTKMASKTIHSTVGHPHFLQQSFSSPFILDRWIDTSTTMLIAFSSVPIFSVYLPPGVDPSFILHLVMSIRDTMNCIAQVNLSSVTVRSDIDALDQLMNDFQTSTNNPLLSLLSTGNQNSVAQVLGSLSQQVNQINTRLINQTISRLSIVRSLCPHSLILFRRCACCIDLSLITDYSSIQLIFFTRGN